MSFPLLGELFHEHEVRVNADRQRGENGKKDSFLLKW